MLKGKGKLGHKYIKKEEINKGKGKDGGKKTDK